MMKTANFVACLSFIVSWLILWYFCTVRVIRERIQMVLKCVKHPLVSAGVIVGIQPDATPNMLLVRYGLKTRK
jgi:hypothetical protein